MIGSTRLESARPFTAVNGVAMFTVSLLLFFDCRGVASQTGPFGRAARDEAMAVGAECTQLTAV
jgi:hypothetical protein